MSEDVGPLVSQADREVAAGNLPGARDLLTRAAQAGSDPALWLRLAGVERATGRPRKALEATQRALELQPRDFVALVLRASLIDQLQPGESGEAWGNALANRPPGGLSPPLAAAVEKGAKIHAAWIEERSHQLAEAISATQQRASEAEARRIERFRTNSLRLTKPFHSEPTDFHFPGLSEREFHPAEMFPWLHEVEAATDVLQQELAAVMAAERAELVPYIQYDAYLPLDQWKALNHNADWTAIHLLRNGERIEANARHCPRAIALLERIPQPHVRGAGPNGMFSLLAPNTHIPPHVGISNARLVCHLPLIVPAGCWFRVGAETREWKRGEAFVFDDTIEHEAMNPSGELRVVFIFDIWHPDLSDVEREAVTALIEALGPTSTGGGHP